MDILLWIGGIVAAIIVAHFYYRLSVNKRLSFFLLIDDQPFARMDRNVRNQLKVHFELPSPPAQANAPAAGAQHVVASLQHLQFVIANTGTRAITFNSPPVIHIPDGKTILDASIIHQCPSDLDAQLARIPIEQGQPQKVVCSVKMLNPREFMVVKFLLSDVAIPTDLQLHVLAEDLPRTISIEPLPPEATKSRFDSIEWPAVLVGGAMMLAAVAMGHLTMLDARANDLPPLAYEGIFDFVHSLKLIHFEIFISFACNCILLVLGTGFAVGVGLMPVTKSKRVILPSELRPASLQPPAI